MGKKKPFAHRWPKAWKPGTGKSGTDHPSVVRDRNPYVRNVLNLSQDWGATHAVFTCNPNCCPICAHKDGRRHRIATILRWTYPLPHPNCLCNWTPEFEKVTKAEMIQSATLMTTPPKPLVPTRYVFSKAAGEAVAMAAQAGSGKIKGKAGLTLVQTSRGRRWKKVARDIDKKAQQVKKKAERKEKVQATVGKLSDKGRESLNKIVNVLRGTKPGEKTEHNGVEIERHPTEPDGFRVHGLAVKGFRVASAVVRGFEQTVATAGQTAGGSIGSGGGMERGGDMTRTTEAAGGKVAEKAGQADAEAARRRIANKRRREAEKKTLERQESKKDREHQKKVERHANKRKKRS